MQTVSFKSGRGGVREGAGRKPTGNYKTIPVRVDERLLPILNIIKNRGLDDALLTKIRDTLTPEDEPIDIVSSLIILYNVSPKNKWRDITHKINEACTALGYQKIRDLKGSDLTSLDVLTTPQQRTVLNWHKEQLKC